jgi:hypothetical protein
MNVSKYSITRRSFISKSSLSLASLATTAFPAMGALMAPLEKKSKRLIPP